MDGRLLAIGDLHGCGDRLQSLLAQIDPGAGDTLVFLGDYLDRGPQVREVIDTLLALREACPRTVCLRGNHEAMFLDFYLRGIGESTYMANGGWSTLASYQTTLAEARAGKGLPESHLRFLTDLPLFHATEDFLFVHAGVRPGIPLEAQDPEDLLWIRDAFRLAPMAFPKTVVFGHTALERPLLLPDRIGIDTGAVFGGPLTGIALPERRIYQA